MAEPAYNRLDVEERRRLLLELGFELFTHHAYDELSMSKIAQEAGISKALLYHYFPSKRDYFIATLAEAAMELQRRTTPDADLPAADQLRAALGAYLELVSENAAAYRKLMQSAAVPEVRELIDGIRDATSARILDGLVPGTSPSPARSAVRAWLWFMDGALLDWTQHRDYELEELRALLLATLAGALERAGATLAADQLRTDA